MDIGLRVEYDGKKNVVLAGEIIKEYPIGGLMCEYARLRPTELKEVILSNPFWSEENLSEKGGEALFAFYNDMVEKFDAIKEKITEIDEKINQVAKGWKTQRMGKAELAILRLAVYEMMYDDTIPVKVAIDEAVNLAKKYGGDGSPSFVNGILAKLA